MPEEEMRAPGQESARHATGLGVPRVFHNKGWYVFFSVVMARCRWYCDQQPTRLTISDIQFFVSAARSMPDPDEIQDTERDTG